MKTNQALRMITTVVMTPLTPQSSKTWKKMGVTLMNPLKAWKTLTMEDMETVSAAVRIT